MTRHAVIVSTARTPIGRAFRGCFNASYSGKWDDVKGCFQFGKPHTKPGELMLYLCSPLPSAPVSHFTQRRRERLEKFALSVHPDKTRLIEFGRHAADNREKRGVGKPETFNFSGAGAMVGASGSRLLCVSRGAPGWEPGARIATAGIVQT
jgi:hypothetical protein